MAFVDLRGVSLTYGLGKDSTLALADATFSIDKGEFVAVVGPSGCGKSTIMKLVTGLLPASTGEVWVAGRLVSNLAEPQLLELHRKVTMVFQSGALFDSMTVADNVAYRLHEDGVAVEEIEPRVREVLRLVELEHTMEQLPSELSGGMRRRVSIARALVNRPPIVLYDSPTAGLDPVTSQTIITLILRLRDIYGVTALLATHRLQDGFALANFHFNPHAERVVANAQNGSGPSTTGARTRFLVYREGEIYFEGEPEEIVNSNDSYLKRFLV